MRVRARTEVHVWHLRTLLSVLALRDLFGSAVKRQGRAGAGTAPRVRVPALDPGAPSARAGAACLQSATNANLENRPRPVPPKRGPWTLGRKGVYTPTPAVLCRRRPGPSARHQGRRPGLRKEVVVAVVAAVVAAGERQAARTARAAGAEGAVGPLRRRLRRAAGSRVPGRVGLALGFRDLRRSSGFGLALGFCGPRRSSRGRLHVVWDAGRG